jgi:hypothetical protein
MASKGVLSALEEEQIIKNRFLAQIASIGKVDTPLNKVSKRYYVHERDNAYLLYRSPILTFPPVSGSFRYLMRSRKAMENPQKRPFLISRERQPCWSCRSVTNLALEMGMT